MVKYYVIKEAEEICKIESPNGRDYFVTIKEEQIIYLNRDCQIYFINNVTERYVQSNKLMQIALIDELTKLPNRRKLLNDYEDLLDQKNSIKNVVMGIIDIDFFKKVNDEYGHNKGDEILILLGSCFNKRLRENNGFYRLGGEEFIVLFRNIEIEVAKQVVIEINNAFRNACLEITGKEITFSGGLVSIMIEDGSENAFDHYFKLADKLLYQAKHNGRNKLRPFKIRIDIKMRRKQCMMLLLLCWARWFNACTYARQ